MIAGKEDRAHAGRGKIAQPLDHLSRIWAPIYEVAQEHDHGLDGMSLEAIVVDPLDEVAEQIVASMNIADRINELARSEPRGRGRWESPEAVEQ